jgi:transposase
MKTTFIGIDTSNATLDFSVRQELEKSSSVISNQIKDIKAFLKKYDGEQTVIAVESTGRYNWPLFQAMEGLKAKLFVLNPLHLKRSMGFTRGKSDKIDAQRICDFIEKHYHDLKQWRPASDCIQKLKVLLSERKSLIKDRKRLMTQLKEYKKMKHLDLQSRVRATSKRLDLVKEQITDLEKEIEKLINSNTDLKEKNKLITSVPGVGQVISWTILAKTEAFSLIDDPRKMACYSGVVPFEHTSGTSVRGKSRVSHHADKTVKTLLHMGAMRAVRLNNDLKDFYERKIAKGKNKMSVLNAVRNKLLHRIFAVVRNQKPYTSVLVLS